MKMCSIVISILLWSGAFAAVTDDSSTAAIDAGVWAVISATVAENDIEAMAATYHPDGVFVYGQGTVPIAKQLSKWGEEMAKTKLEGARASVSFRFERRQDDAETAFEVGLFKYSESDKSGAENAVYVPFEVLLVRKNADWLILMERQLAATDETAWKALEE
jgi:uncharacterized protein (TIGR02246 family)